MNRIETGIKPGGKIVILESFLKDATPEEPMDIRGAAQDLYPDLDPEKATARTQDLLKYIRKSNPGKIRKINDRRRHGFYYWDEPEDIKNQRWISGPDGKPLVKVVPKGGKNGDDAQSVALTPHQINVLRVISWNPTSASTIIESLYSDKNYSNPENSLSQEVRRIKKALRHTNIGITNDNVGGNDHQEASYRLVFIKPKEDEKPAPVEAKAEDKIENAPTPPTPVSGTSNEANEPIKLPPRVEYALSIFAEKEKVDKADLPDNFRVDEFNEHVKKIGKVAVNRNRGAKRKALYELVDLEEKPESTAQEHLKLFVPGIPIQSDALPQNFNINKINALLEGTENVLVNRTRGGNRKGTYVLINRNELPGKKHFLLRMGKEQNIRLRGRKIMSRRVFDNGTETNLIHDTGLLVRHKAVKAERRHAPKKPKRQEVKKERRKARIKETPKTETVLTENVEVKINGTGLTPEDRYWIARTLSSFEGQYNLSEIFGYDIGKNLKLIRTLVKATSRGNYSYDSQVGLKVQELFNGPRNELSKVYKDIPWIKEVYTILSSKEGLSAGDAFRQMFHDLRPRYPIR